MRKQLLFILVFLIISTLSFAQTAYKVHSNGGLNLRESPNGNSKIISSLPDGTKVTVVDKSDSKWWKVKVDGKTGYVSSDFLKEDNKSSNQNNKQQAQQSNNNNRNSSSTNSSSGRQQSSGQQQKSSANSSSGSNNYNWGVGLRLGDPFGLTVKKYVQNNRAWELNIGRTTYWGYNYQNRFHKHDRFRNYYYNGFDRNGALSIQFHYLYHKDIKNADGLQWYLGFGPQARFKTFSYHYRYRAFHPNGQEYWAYAWDKVTDVDLGIDGVIGLEYRFNNSPFAIFGEGNLFFEIIDHPSIIGQGGIGLRVNF